jgi:heterodisulfide reductase subunit C
MPNDEKGSEPFELKEDDFALVISERPGGETAKYCFQCGTCSSVCPVGYIDSDYNPKKIMKMVLLNMEEELVKSDFIWLCSACYSCSERCPQGVKIPYVINAVQRWASKKGYAHLNYKAGIDLLDGHGRLVEVNKFINKTREKLEMPTLDEDTKEIKVLLDKVGVKKTIEKNDIEQREDEKH